MKTVRLRSLHISAEVSIAVLVLLLILLPVIVAVSQKQEASLTKAQASSGGWPSTPPAPICTTQDWLNGPSTPPADAITVPAGDNSNVDFNQTNKIFWFVPGVHTLGTDQYSQIEPGSNSTYIGAPGAILDGQNLNLYAFTQHATNVRVAYLEIRNFGRGLDNNNEGVINHDAGTNWTMEYLYAHHNDGAAIFMGTDNTLRYSCLKDNGQYGFSMYKDPVPGDSAIKNIVIDHTEIVGNNQDDWEKRIEGCGCTGGGKFWDVKDAQITNNYVHDNLSVGLWADTNDIDFLFDGNWIENNSDEAIFYEVSYNAVIRNNVIKRNAIKKGQEFASQGDNFPITAVYISESGGDSRVASATTRTANLEINNNYFEDNWGGVALWENADRYCNSPANTSSGYCTAVNPSVKLNTCSSGTINNQPYYADCRWKTQNVSVHDNEFHMNPTNVSNCNSAYCGRMAIISNYGTYPSWSPYKATVIQDAITFNQNNHWLNNVYSGTWKFVARDTGNTISYAAWQASPYNQDTGSTFNGTSSPTATTGPALPTATPTSQTDLPTLQPTAVPTKLPTSTSAPLPTATLTPAGTNIFDQNTAGFEGSLGKWSNWYSEKISVSNLAAHSGNRSMQVKVTAPNGWGVQMSNWPGFKATPGTKTISFWALKGTGNVWVNMNVQWLNSSQKVLQTNQLVLPSLTSSWQKSSAVITAPAGTASVYVTFTNTGNAGTILYLDEITISK